MQIRSKPETFEPPYPAHTTIFPDVAIVAEAGFRAVYNNRHPDAGFLPFLESEEAR
jgi:hypothetical protein